MDYKNFEKYVLRTPLFPFSLYQKLTSQKNIANEDLKKVCQNLIFQEAIFLASPSLHQSMEKWLNGESLEDKKLKKLKQSILKYASRIASRCTPFGLFAGCALGEFDSNTNIQLKQSNQHGRHTELDMNFLVALSQKLAEIDLVKKQLLFFPNTSIYKVRGQLRYVEYTYVKNLRQHQITSVDHSEYLQEILNKAAEGATLNVLAETIVEEDISFEEAYAFVEELIESQLLISELEPSISGESFFDQIIETLRRLENTENLLEVLEKVKLSINQLDTTIGNTTELYTSIETLLLSLDLEFDERFLFQTDMITRTDSNQIDRNLINGLKKSIELISKVSRPIKVEMLEKFRSSFYDRFEEGHVSLAKALDMETGVNYNSDYGTGEINPLVDHLILPGSSNSNSSKEFQWTKADQFFQQKLLEANRTKAYTITLTDKELDKLELVENPFPDTFSVMTEIIHMEGAQKIFLKGGGGASAASILGRFCQGNKDLHQYVQEIVEMESKMNRDKLVAEILHLPESRVGNVLKRPHLRDYEIPYLSKSTKSRENQLTIDDLVVTTPLNRRVALWSKKHQKEVITRLTNAHNYALNPLPIYRFLCELQIQEVQGGVGFVYGPFRKEFEFLPRLEYHDVIIHKATWNLTSDHVKEMKNHQNDDDQLLLEADKLRSKLQIPQYVSLTQGDNHLLINLKNADSIRMLLAEVQKRTTFEIIEFFFSENGSVQSAAGYHTNEVIVSFYNHKKLKA